MLNRKMKPIAAAVGAAFAVSLAAGAAAEANAVDPFESQVLDGVQFADADSADSEGGCGEDRKMPEGGMAEGEGDMAEGEGDMAEGEGKCGEGKCGEGESGEGEEESDAEAEAEEPS